MSVAMSWLSSAPGTGILGSTTPRLWTPPLVEGMPGPCGCGCALTPDTSYGFDVVEFGESLEPRWVQLGNKRVKFSGQLDPWQRWAVIHAGELLSDGRPRFRKVLIVVARQNGKTTMLVVLSLWWMFVRRYPMLFGTSTKIETAKEPWSLVAAVATTYPQLSRYMPNDRSGGVKTVNGGIELATADGSRYLIGPTNEDAGRSLTLDRLILDELRKHTDYSAWDAAVPAGNAVADFQAFAITNMGGSDAVVLNDLIEEGTAFVETGKGDPRLGVFLWTNPENADPTDVEALAASNPNMGRRLEAETLLADAAAAVRAGGEKLAGFKTEILCAKSDNPDDAPVTEAAWAACLDEGLTLEDLRSRVAVCLDVSPDGRHVSLVAAAQDDEGLVLVDVVRAWSGDQATEEMRADLPDLVARVKPRKRFYFPAGPAAAVKADLEALRFEALGSADSVASCMGLAELVRSGRLRQGGDPLLTDHVLGAKKWPAGDGWRFVRKGAGHVDAAYAAGGAVLKARRSTKERNIHWL